MSSSKYSNNILGRISLGLVIALSLVFSLVSSGELSAKPRKRALAQRLRPITDGLVPMRAAQYRPRGDGQYGRQRVTPALGAARVGDRVEKIG